MKRFAGILHHQVQRLDDAIRHQQEMRCREIIADADRKAKQAIRDSRGRLLKHQQQAVREERQRREHELLIAKSRVETAQRRRAFARHEKVLQSAWPLLLEALALRWLDADHRRAWCDMIVTEAAATLMGTDWVIEHPADFPADDRDALLDRVHTLGLAAPSFAACKDIPSGLRIRTGTSCLDGTIDGLLGSRDDVEALLLAAWEQQAEQEPENRDD